MRYTFTNSFLRADLCPILHSMQGEVDFWYRFFVEHCPFYRVTHIDGCVRHERSSTSNDFP